MKQALKWLLPAIGTEKHRKNLMFVKVTILNNRMTLMSANAFCIKRYFCPTDLDNCEFFIDLDSVKKAIKISGKDKIDMLQDHFQIDNISIKYAELEYDYPDLKNLTDISFEAVTSAFGINPDTFALCMKDRPAETSVVKFRFSRVDGPIKLSFNHEIDYDFDAFIMPVRISW